MRKILLYTLTLAMALPLLGPGAVIAQGGGVYEEDFSTYTAKDYTERADWDVWGRALRLAPIDGTNQQSPSVAIGEEGNAIVVWEDWRNGNGDIYAQMLDPDGNWLWPTAVRVNSDSGTAAQSAPAVIVNGSGNALVVWADWRDGDADIYAQKLDGSGNKLWSADLRVNSDAGTAGQGYPAIAEDESGNAIVVWTDTRNDDWDIDIYAQKLDENGNRLWSADRCVNSDTGTTWWYTKPAVAVDGSGNAVVVWQDERDGNWDIYAQKLDGNGNKLWGADQRVNSDTGTADQMHPAVMVDGNGNAFVVWQDRRDSNDDIYAQKLDGSGNKLWSADLRVNSDAGTAWQQYPAVTLVGSGNALAVWGDRNDIYAQKLDGSGNKLWSADLRVNSDTGAASQWDPAIAVDEIGNAFVVWEDKRDGWGNIYAQRLDGSGNKLWSADLRVNPDTGTAGQGYPAVAQDGIGNAFVVWQDRRDSNRNIYAQKLDGSGNKLWSADLRVNSDTGTAGQNGPAVAVDGNGNAIVVWAGRRNSNNDIYAQKLDGSGNRLWSADLRVNADTGTVSLWDSPAVAVDGGGNIIVVWTDYRGGNIIVVWTDYRDGNHDIYARKLDGDGDKLWSADLRVNSDTGTAGQYGPAVAVDGSGNALVVWTDPRSGNDDIYARVNFRPIRGQTFSAIGGQSGNDADRIPEAK